MSAPSCTYGSTNSSTFGSPPQTKLVPAEARYYLEEGLEGVERHEYRSVRSFVTTITKHMDEFQFGGAAQYAVYSPVSDEEFTKIDNARDRHLKGLDQVPLSHQRKGVDCQIHSGRKASLMDSGKELGDIGKTRFSGLGSQKEADTSVLGTLKGGCEMVVRELKGRGGNCYSCCYFKGTRSLHVEIWELVDMPNLDITRANPDPFITGVVTKTGEGGIVGEVVTGAPLKISFKKTMLRDPDEALGENDFVIDVQDFKEVAQMAWDFS
ncbi:hypothetical protein B9Z19DRAFT_1119267 [Tuber borchii]|uniref:Uncharacterized protein n=1 Tax=Tuber borchii TaxID=42251 RepID=A0A2T7A6S0_TUBBO|nr:hypothetical protein B9Z19DRAFT_1119267 [Tuber borchii]